MVCRERTSTTLFLPREVNSASQIVVGKGSKEYRVYVNPATLQILKVDDEDKRPMNVLFYLHGELLLGDRGSNVVELAASWAIVLLVTGVYLWWPRQTQRLAGVLYVRLRPGTTRILARPSCRYGNLDCRICFVYSA